MLFAEDDVARAARLVIATCIGACLWLALVFIHQAINGRVCLNAGRLDGRQRAGQFKGGGSARP